MKGGKGNKGSQGPGRATLRHEAFEGARWESRGYGDGERRRELREARAQAARAAEVSSTEVLEPKGTMAVINGAEMRG